MRAVSVQPVRNEIHRGSDVLEVLEGEYVLVSLPANARVQLPDAGELRVLVHDPVEITLILEVSAWDAMASQHPDARANRGYRAVRLAQDFPLETVGVMAKLTNALAQAGVSIMAYSTFKTDVVLVRQWELNTALGALWDLRF
jgi:hypothetical protein